MNLGELVRCLTKYYVVIIANDSSRYEDQTVIPNWTLCRRVETIDFYEDCGEGEMLLISLYENSR